jgi:hypothetical protein
MVANSRWKVVYKFMSALTTFWTVEILILGELWLGWLEINAIFLLFFSACRSVPGQNGE